MYLTLVNAGAVTISRKVELSGQLAYMSLGFLPAATLLNPIVHA